MHHLRVFGCQAHMLVRKEMRVGKFVAVTTEGILLGFSDDNFNYRVYDLESRKIRTTHDVKFIENVFPYCKFKSHSESEVLIFEDEPQTTPTSEAEPSNDPPQNVCPDTDSDDEDGIETNQPDQTQKTSTPAATAPEMPASNMPRHSRTLRQRPGLNYKGMCNLVEQDGLTFISSFSVLSESFAGAIIDIPVPKTFKHAMNSEEKEHWNKACDKEFGSLTSKNVWKLVNKPVGKNILRGFWIF